MLTYSKVLKYSTSYGWDTNQSIRPECLSMYLFCLLVLALIIQHRRQVIHTRCVCCGTLAPWAYWQRFPSAPRPTMEQVPFSSVQSPYVVELKTSLRRRLVCYTHARCVNRELYRPPIFGSADSFSYSIYTFLSTTTPMIPRWFSG